MENEEYQKELKENIHRNINDRMYRDWHRRPHNNGLGALVIIVVGIVLLLSRIPQTAYLFPNWLFDWPTILIIVGIFVGVRNGFGRHFGWLGLILIGTFFLLRNNRILSSQWDLYSLPIFLIIAGFFLLIKRRSCHYRFDDPNNPHNRHFYERMKRKQEFWERRGQRFNDKFGNKAQFVDKSNQDYVDINSVFGSAEKSMFTKTFKGGNITSTFGGSELNLSQADIEDTAILNISITFGGAEIIVPSNWTVQNELSVVLGGIDDKRRLSSPAVPPKILILKGSVLCGGIEIKN